MKYLRKFETEAEYSAATLNYPNVSWVVESDKVYFDKVAPTPPVYQGFCKLTLNNGSVVELEGSGELSSAMTKQYSATCVSVEIGTLCTSIGSYAFYQCTSLTSIDIPDSVTSIGYNAFQVCRSLTSIDIPNSVTSIGNSTFQGCTGLTRCTIGSGVTSISNSAFNGCTSLISINIPDSVTFIGKFSFTSCSSLTSIDIPSGVTSIGQNAFNGCSSLTSITSLATTAPTIQNNTFQSVKTNGTLYVPIGSTGYDTWMGTGNYYLGKYNWTKVEQ